MTKLILILIICLAFCLAINGFCAEKSKVYNPRLVHNTGFDYRSDDVVVPPAPGLPTIQITAPTNLDAYSTNLSSINIGGVATCGQSIADINWVNDKGGSGKCTGTTSWNVNDITLKPGVNVITVTIIDIKNNTAFDTLTVTFTDTTAPGIIISIPTSTGTYATNISSINIGGTASDNTEITSITWANNRGGSGTCNGISSWNVTGIVLLTGSNVITVTAVDSSNNKSIATLTVTYDISAPVVKIVSPTSLPSYTATTASITMSGTASDDSGIASVAWANDRGGSGTCTGTTSWSTTTAITLQPGTNIITITATDSTNSKGSASISVIYDNDIPIVSITTPTPDAAYFISAPSIDLSGTASDMVGVTSVKWANSKGGSGSCIGTGSWAVTAIPLKGGDNIITISAYDATNKKGTDAITITSDQTVPTVSITSPTTANTYNTLLSTVTVSGTSGDDTGVVKVEWENVAGGKGLCTGTTSWSTGEITLYDGTNTIIITATDKANRTTQDTLLIYCDLSNPLIAITTPSTDIYNTNNPKLNLAGTASYIHSLSSITWTSSTGKSGTGTGKESWTISNLPLSAGENIITVTVKAVNGKSNTDVVTVNYYAGVPGDKWKGLAMVSLPIIPADDDPFVVVSFVQNGWCSFDPAANVYYQYPDAQTYFNPLTSTPSRGFWASSPKIIAIPYGQVPDQGKPSSIHLKPGWNLIGNPFITDITWSLKSIQVKEAGKAAISLEEAVTVVDNFLWGWKQDAVNAYIGAYFIVCDSSINPKATNKFETWRGYWIKAAKECDIIIPAP